jgi:hypothetical protein
MQAREYGHSLCGSMPARFVARMSREMQRPAAR